MRTPTILKRLKRIWRDILRQFRRETQDSLPQWLDKIASQLKKRFELDDIRPICTNTTLARKNSKFPRTFYQAWLNGRKIFIKHAEFAREIGKEFVLNNRLYQKNKDNFQEALFYAEDEHDCSIAYEFLEGETLADKIKSTDFSPSERESVILQLKDIAKSLLEDSVVHRDVHASNFFITKEGKLKLIDFGSAVDSEQFFRERPMLLLCSDTDFFMKLYCWNDMSSMLNILGKIECRESYRETYGEVESFLKTHLGKKVTTYKYRHVFVIPLILAKLPQIVEFRILRPVGHRLRRILRGY